MTDDKTINKTTIEDAQHWFDTEIVPRCYGSERKHIWAIRTALETLIDTRLPSPPREGWMDIESCPTDGKDVLLAYKNSIKPLIHDNANVPDWLMEVHPFCTHGSGGARSYHSQATHWMPLPSPPEKKP